MVTALVEGIFSEILFYPCKAIDILKVEPLSSILRSSNG